MQKKTGLRPWLPVNSTSVVVVITGWIVVDSDDGIVVVVLVIVEFVVDEEEDVELCVITKSLTLNTLISST